MGALPLESPAARRKLVFLILTRSLYREVASRPIHIEPTRNVAGVLHVAVELFFFGLVWGWCVTQWLMVAHRS
jgi:hypothetical protein